MSKRQLPPRSTRGQKPITTNQQQQRKDDLLYERMFGKDLDDEADYAEKQAKDQIRKNIMIGNIKQYAYSRGYHYFYDLNQFTRLDGHPSYAIQHLNVFGSTYSKQDTEYKGSKLSQLINRVYIGLPMKDGIPHVNKQDKCKNICHGYLFDTEDKKYLLDRTINTYKKVYKNILKITSSNKMRQFKLIRNDAELSVLIDGSEDITVQQQALLRRIAVLEQRKNNNTSNWLNDDKSFYHHSLNQQLHDKISELKDEYSIQRIGTILFVNQSMLAELIHSQLQDVTQFLKISMRYYNTVSKALKQDTIQQIQEKCAKNILKDNGSQQSNIIFPTQIFSFGSPELLAQVNCIIGSRIYRYNQTNYYSAKFAWKKLFDCDLSMTPKGQQKPLIYEQYSKMVKEQVEAAKQFFLKMESKGETVQAVKCPLLDHLINWQKIQEENVSPNTKILLERQNKRITGKQFVIVVLYDWLCKGFNQLMPYLSINPQFQQIFTYEYFNKFSHGIVETTAKPIVGIISSCLDILCDFISKQDPFQGLDLQLQFEFHKNENIGILWRLKEEQVWETQSQQIDEDPEEDQSNEDNQQEQGHLIPSKKVKQQ